MKEVVSLVRKTKLAVLSKARRMEMSATDLDEMREMFNWLISRINELSTDSTGKEK